MADLSVLNTNAPLLASYFAGQNQGQDVQINQIKQQELAQIIQQRQQEAAFAAQKQPGDLQHQQLINAGLQTANSTNDLKLDTDRQTQPSAIAATNSTNDKTVADNKLAQYQHAEQTLLEAGPVIANTPPALRAQVLRDHLIAAGMNPDAAQFKTVMATDPNQMPGAISSLAKAVGDQRLTLDTHARAEMYGADQRRAGEVQAANIHAGATRYAADQQLKGKEVTAAAKMKGNDLLTKLKNGEISFEKAMGGAIANFQTADTEGDRNMWASIGNMIQSAQAAKAQGGHEGETSITPTPGGGAALTPRTAKPVFNQPKGSGTKDDPIKLD